MTTLVTENVFCEKRYGVDLYVRGRLPEALQGSLVIALSRRHKDRRVYSRWQDSQADLLRLDLHPGKPGKIRAEFLAVDPRGADLGDAFTPNEYEAFALEGDAACGYATQPNHGLNVVGNTIWATNLLFGAPLEVRLDTLEPQRLVRCVEPDEDRPRLASTAHFGESLDRGKLYFVQSLLTREGDGRPVQATDLRLVELDTKTGSQRFWSLAAPPQDDRAEAANFHSVFYWEEDGRAHVGMLRTGVVLSGIGPDPNLADGRSHRMPPSTIWTVELDNGADALQAELLPGVLEVDGLALSHLDIDNASGDGFVLYANYKEADVGKETLGTNVYGERPEDVIEHYNGMIVEPLRHGKVMRYERRAGRHSIEVFERAYEPGRASAGHTWQPINIELDDSKEHLFCSFGGLHPRLLPRYVAETYRERVVDPQTVRFVPSLLMRLDASTLRPVETEGRRAVSYTEPVAMSVIGDLDSGYVCTFSPEKGLRVYRAGDLSRMVCIAEAMDMRYWGDQHFRGEPAHMIFAPR